MAKDKTRLRRRVGRPGANQQPDRAIHSCVASIMEAVDRLSRELPESTDELLEDLGLPEDVLEALLEGAQELETMGKALESKKLNELGDKLVWCYDSLAPSDTEEVTPLPHEIAAEEVRELVKEKFSVLRSRLSGLTDEVERAASEASDVIAELTLANEELSERLEECESDDG